MSVTCCGNLITGKMEKIEAQSVIKFLHMKGNSAQQIYDEMKAVYGDDCPSFSTVAFWKRNFQTGHLSLTDEPRSGRPSLTDDAATVKKVRNLIMEDRRVTISMIKHETDISYGSVWTVEYNSSPIAHVKSVSTVGSALADSSTEACTC